MERRIRQWIGTAMLAGLAGCSATPPSQSSSIVTKPEAPSPYTLQVRYCPCLVSESGNINAPVSPQFIEQSQLMVTNVSERDSGSLSADDITVDYQLAQLPAYGTLFQMLYVAKYSEGGQDMDANGQLVLQPGQWVNAASVQHFSATGEQYLSIAIRIVENSAP